MTILLFLPSFFKGPLIVGITHRAFHFPLIVANYVLPWKLNLSRYDRFVPRFHTHTRLYTHYIAMLYLLEGIAVSCTCRALRISQTRSLIARNTDTKLVSSYVLLLGGLWHQTTCGVCIYWIFQFGIASRLFTHRLRARLSLCLAWRQNTRIYSQTRA